MLNFVCTSECELYIHSVFVAKIAIITSLNVLKTVLLNGLRSQRFICSSVYWTGIFNNNNLS